jgi:hypothetical protein
MKFKILIIAVICFNFGIIAQVIEKPNFALASHPMTIGKIEFIANQTVVSLSIENQSETGSFCADRNIYIQDVIKNTIYKLIQSKGIPVCPDNY